MAKQRTDQIGMVKDVDYTPAKMSRSAVCRLGGGELSEDFVQERRKNFR